MTMKEIIESYLKKNGFTGLYNNWLECGCSINDLCICEEPGWDCKPGYTHYCRNCNLKGSEDCPEGLYYCVREEQIINKEKENRCF